jgi:hypothetical protein
MRSVDHIPEVATQLCKVLWPEEEVPVDPLLANERLKSAGRRIREWQCSAARAGADAALRVACSWYPELDLDALIGVREEAPTDLDPVLTAKREDRAYRIAEYATMRTFIPLLQVSKIISATRKTRKMKMPRFRKLQKPVLPALRLPLFKCLLLSV